MYKINKIKMSKIVKILNSIKSSLINDCFSLTHDENIYKLTNEYFQLIRELIKKYNTKKIKPKDSNISKISFPKNINYKILILKYIAFEFEKGNIWIKELYEKIIDQSFPSEKYFLYLFNISEFEIKTRPQCFQNPHKKTKYIPQSKYFTFNIIDDVLSDDPLIQHKLYKQYIYEYVQIIRDQIEISINPINFIMKNFIICFNKHLMNIRNEIIIIKRTKSNIVLEENIKKICSNIFEQINNFIYNLTNCLILLYSEINNYQIFFEEIDEFISLLTSLFFSSDEINTNINQNELLFNDIYKIILDLLRYKNITQIEKLKKISNSYKGIEPEDFGVNEKFCLTEKSVNYYMKIYKKNFPGNVPQIAFEKSIKMLKKIYLYKSPVDKLLLTTKMRGCIYEEIKEFWKQIPEDERNNKELKLDISIDDYINIFEYLIIKSDMNDLIIHIEFVESFTSEKTRKNFDDYILQQIKVGLMQLNDLDINK